MSNGGAIAKKGNMDGGNSLRDTKIRLCSLFFFSVRIVFRTRGGVEKTHCIQIG